MIHDRVVKDPFDRCMVVPAWTAIASVVETYSSRQAAQGLADGLNHLAEQNRSAGKVTSSPGSSSAQPLSGVRGSLAANLPLPVALWTGTGADGDRTPTG